MESSEASNAAAAVVSTVAAVLVMTFTLMSCAKGDRKRDIARSPISDQQLQPRSPMSAPLSAENDDDDDDDDDDNFVIQEETEEDEHDRCISTPVADHVDQQPAAPAATLNLPDADVYNQPGQRRSQIVFQMDDVDDIGGYSVVDDSPRGAKGKEGLYARVIPKKTRPMSVPPEKITLAIAEAVVVGAPALPERRYSTGGVMHSMLHKSPDKQPTETHEHDLEELRQMALMARTSSAGEPEEDPNFDMATLKLILGKTDGGAGESSSTDSPEPPSPTITPAANPPPTLLLSPVNEEQDPRADYEGNRSGSYMSAVFQHTFERETFV